MNDMTLFEALTVYLPYVTQIKSYEDDGNVKVLEAKHLGKHYYRMFNVLKYKPILIPMSLISNALLPRHIKWSELLAEYTIDKQSYQHWPHYVVNILIKNKVDVFNMIDDGFAIDVTSLIN